HVDVVDLGSADGAQVWRQQLAADGLADVFASPRLLGDPSGDLIFVASLGDYSNVAGPAGPRLFPGFTSAGLSGADRTVRWRRADDGAAVPGAFVPASATLAGTVVVVAGSLNGHGDGPAAFEVISLSAANGALGACGDGFKDADEQCDDGNLTDGDCCSADCRTPGRDGLACGSKNQ